MYNSDKLKATQKLLEDLGNGMIALFNEYKEDFLGDELVTSQFKSFFEEHKRAMERIKNPVLSIATIGTTSSGKSTLTNALAGKMVAPIDSGEKSAGILVLRNSNKRSLYIEKTKNSKWKTGQIKQDISDEETYNINSDTMKTYFDNRKNSAPPRIYSKGPLLIGSSPEMLNLPEDICVELVDLPGLKNSGDKENLSVIQEMLTRSLCLVAMDYSHTDDENRKKLLGELKDIVNFLGGRQDSIIFCLTE
ncbi:dynamin family protein [Ruminiclostridium papyrosolvens]|uniref:dynamin family protein n=1 Tax=Ruminiclostridium papyrosolvens TaxID=29362 RepID=UPI001FA6D3B5|nr:dynamin family protein [Ruminiclostridium papyrosolvens]